MPPARRSRSRKNDPPQTPSPAVVMLLALAAAAVAVWLGYPGVVLVWLGAFIAGNCSTQPVFSGPKDQYGMETPASEAERAQARTHRMWRGMRSAIFNPLPLLRSPWTALAAAGVAAMLFTLPVLGHEWFRVAAAEFINSTVENPEPIGTLAQPGSDQEVLWHAVNAIAGVLTLGALFDGWVNSRNDFEPAPVGSWANLREVFAGEKWRTRLVLGLAVLVSGFIAGYAAAAVLAVQLDATAVSPLVLYGAGAAVAGTGMTVLTYLLLAPAWQRRVDSAVRWRDVFTDKHAGIKFPTPPAVRASDRYPEYGMEVVEFAMERMQFDAVAQKSQELVSAYNDPGTEIQILPAYRREDDGSRGAQDTFAFRAVLVADGQWPDLATNLPAHIASLAMESMLAQAGWNFQKNPPATSLASPVIAGTAPTVAKQDPLMANTEPDDTDPASQVWVIDVHSGDYPALLGYWDNDPAFSRFGERTAVMAFKPGDSDAQAMRVWAGDIDSEDIDPALRQQWDEVRLGRDWMQRWESALNGTKGFKDSDGPHHLEISAIQEIDFSLAGYDDAGRPRRNRNTGSAGVIHVMPFVGRGNKSVADLFNVALEENMRTSVAEGGRQAVWLMNLPYAERSAIRKSAAAASLMLTAYSTTDVFADPQHIAPVITPKGGAANTEALKTVFSAIIGRGFDAAGSKLAGRPTVIAARHLTGQDSERSVWRVELALPPGVTVSDLRKHLSIVQQATQSAWMAVSTTGDGREGVLQSGCYLFIGPEPDDQKLEFTGRSARSMRAYFEQVVWEHAFGLAGITAADGSAPRMLAIEAIPENEAVFNLEFAIPPGKSVANFEGKLDSLRSLTGNQFLQIRNDGSDPSVVYMQAAKQDPLPKFAPINWDAMTDGTPLLPFATRVEGTTVAINPKADPHLTVYGQSNSGKSVTLQVLIEAMLMNNAEVYVGDAIKQATDFVMFKPWLCGFSTTPLSVKKMVTHFYQEGVRRNDLRAKYGVSDVRDLPEHEQLPAAYLVLDEMTSFFEKIGKEQKVTGSETMEEQREIHRANQEIRAVSSVAVLIGQIARELRATDMHLVISGQSFKSDLTSKVPAMKAVKSSSSAVVLGNMPYADLASAFKRASESPRIDSPGKGRGLYETSTAVAEVVQSWWDVDEAGNPLKEEPFKAKLAAMLDRQGVERTDMVDFDTLAAEEEASGGTQIFGDQVDEESFVVDAGTVDLSDQSMPAELLAMMAAGAESADTSTESADTDPAEPEFEGDWGDVAESVEQVLPVPVEPAPPEQVLPAPTPLPTPPIPAVPTPVTESIDLLAGPALHVYPEQVLTVAMPLADPHGDIAPVSTSGGNYWASGAVVNFLADRAQYGPVRALGGDDLARSLLEEVIDALVPFASMPTEGSLLSFAPATDGADYPGLEILDAAAALPATEPAPTPAPAPAPARRKLPQVQSVDAPVTAVAPAPLPPAQPVPVVPAAPSMPQPAVPSLPGMQPPQAPVTPSMPQPPKLPGM